MCSRSTKAEWWSSRAGVGGFSTKIHATVDALGNPLRLLLTSGQRGGATQAIALLEGFDFGGVMGDRGYDAKAVIPSKKNRNISFLSFASALIWLR